MAFLAHSELMRLLTGIEEKNLERFFTLLSRHILTDLRFNVLKALAKMERATVSEVLRSIKQTSSGGTYVSISNFFKSLEKEKLLSKTQVGRRTYWHFSSEASDLAKYLHITKYRQIP